MNEEDYLASKAFLRVLLNVAPNSLGKSDLGDQVEHELSALYAKSPSDARRTLKATLDDTLQRATEWMPAEIAALDEVLDRMGVVPLTQALLKHSRLCQKLVKAKRLRTETDYYLAKGYLESSFQELAPDARGQLESLLTEFEERQGARKKS